MLLEKPEEVQHANSSGTACAIYGIDAHPTKRVFATAGGDNCVKIWSLEVDVKEDDSSMSFELIATLSFHQQAVNCVRWAGHGRYLASGSDDQFVFLYELQSGAPPPVPFGSTAKPNKENWTRCASLKRHTMDVQDVAWSPDDRMLASCSIDNSIVIWAVDSASIKPSMTQPLQVLTGHSGWVKGVAWDPVGKYLSSAGEDKTVRMWQVDNWKESTSISEPFESCAATSHFRRLSWSPDGSVLCATHAFKSKKNIAALLDRGTWTNDVKFVGHQSVVTCTRFNPKLLSSKAAPEKEFACCAVGGEDAAVSIWLAHLARPLAVVKDCFDACVTDLTWAGDDSILLASSLDGSICCFQFTSNEIGSPLSSTEQSKLLQAKYGSRAGVTLASELAENPIQLEMEQASKPETKVTTSAPAVETPSSTMNTLVPRKKKETKDVNVLTVKKSDKKKIAPVTVTSSTTPNGDVPSDTTVMENRMAGTSEPSTSTKTIVTKAKTKAKTDSSLKRKREEKQTTPASKSREVASRPPKKLSTGTSSSTQTRILPEFPIRLSFTIDMDVATDEPRLHPSEESSKCQVEVNVHNIEVNDEMVEEHGPVFSTITCRSTTQIKWMDRVPGRISCAVGNARFCAFATSSGDLYLLSASGRRLFPCISLGSAPSVLECNPKLSPYLLVLLSDGKLRIWNVCAGKQTLSESIESVTSLEDSAMKRLTLLRCNLTSDGMPLITFVVSSKDGKGSSSMQSFLFDKDMQVWMRAADDSFVFSDFASSLPTDAVSVNSIPIGPLRRLQNAAGYSRTHRGVSSAMLSGIHDSLLQRNITRSHLEHQVASARVLRSAKEYRYWIQAYARFLAQDEDVSRLEELCAELMGPFHTTSDSEVWDPSILGMSKRELLTNQVLPIMAKNRSLQRVVTKYQLMLRDSTERTEEVNASPL